ncbi:hypothetical protein B0J13DRAFT_325449 [Dactylonectria estremocensis]|uniref:Glycosyltransferase family 31 protein n=1 Tax=Dactylonectria estremocensis TaxID=1079267 RepID=A0A9P9EVE2_9HYPO|nr:hypothetical protein B0J13DRAFT_325449 [Dactylonectria estremocensis]
MVVLTGPPALPSKAVRLLFAVFVLILFLYTNRLSRSQARNIEIDLAGLAAEGPPAEEQYLNRLKKEYGLTNYTAWSAWRIRTLEQASEPESVTNLNADFHSNEFNSIDVNTPIRSQLVAQKQLDVTVPGGPLPAQVDASDFLFAVSTSYEQVKEADFAMVKNWARYLTGGNRYGNGATFLLVLDQSPEHQVDELSEILKFQGIDAHITTTTMAMSVAERYIGMMQLVKDLGGKLAQKGHRKKWFGILDDRVFLPNLSYLQQRLFSYNSDRDVYVGVPSERADWAIGDGFATTYGGGAVFLTLSALSRVPGLPCLADKDKSNNKGWDNVLQDCLTHHTDMVMHVLPSFYSPSDNDEYAARTDSYETGVQPLALHHPEDRHQLTPSTAHLVTDVCGESCFLQRYRFTDNWILVNGYAVTEYPDGMNMADMPGSGAGRKAVIGPLLLDDDGIKRKMLFYTGRRRVWRLLDSVRDSDGSVWQAYVKRASVEDTPSFKRSTDELMDSVIVLIWETAASARQ